jgi:hypothetical protein
MNRASILATLTLLLAGASSSYAAFLTQSPAAPPAARPESAPKGSIVYDDDGGRTQIVPRREAEGREATDHGGPVLAHGTVQAVFLGSAWRQPENREKEAVAMKALQAPASEESLAKYRVKPWEASLPPVEDLTGDPLSASSLTDLEIQARLDALVNGPVDLNAVYVVFLAPGLGSTLGPKRSEKDYAAYHNDYHAAGGLVRYVVVPYDADAARWTAGALAGLRQAVINPEGNGWY